jgi:hypothetical protein
MKCYIIYNNTLANISGFVLSPTKDLKIDFVKRIHLFDSELSLETPFFIPHLDENTVRSYETIKRRLKLL